METENYDDYESDPHFVTYNDDLKRQVIADLEKLSGVEYREQYKFTPSENDFLPPQYHYLESETTQSFIQNIVLQGYQNKAVAYLDVELEKLTERIKYNPDAKGKLTPWDSDDDGYFWEEEDDNYKAQRLEIERLFRVWLQDFRRRLFIEPAQSSEAAPAPDPRLKYTCSTEKVKDYFMQLTQKSSDGKPYYNEQQVNSFLQSNFTGFNSPIPIRSLPKTPKLNQIKITRFIYEFYVKFGASDNKAIDYAKLLKENFSEYFSNYEVDNLASNLAKSTTCHGYKFSVL